MKQRKICLTCKTKDVTIKITKNSHTQYYICRKCNTKRAKKYRETKEGRKRIYVALKKNYKKDKKKQYARAYLNQYYRYHKLKKLNCEKCGADKAQAHHSNYDEPLKVKFLCVGCHFDLHRLLKNKIILYN